jgi:hypothetical protein
MLGMVRQDILRRAAARSQGADAVTHARVRSGKMRAAPLDTLRARALRGDRLSEVADARREWVLRSLLKGVRLQEAQALSGLADSDMEHALEIVRRTYQARIEDFKRQPRGQRPMVHEIDERRQLAVRSKGVRRWWQLGHGW